MATVREVTYDLLRDLGMTTVFGNPGSTEEPFLERFPSDFTYVLALQEASAVAMADGYAQVTGKPAHVNLHTTPGVGNGMGNLATAWHNRTPLIVSSGQQHRDMLRLEPLLTNRYAHLLPMPYVKWSYEPARAQDVPAAFMQAYALAVQPPSGPVFLSIPMDDWEQPADGAPARRKVSARIAAEPDMLREFVDALAGARNPAIVFGGGVDRAGGWDDAVRLAEKLRAPVWSAPWSMRASFPEDHPQYQGMLPPAIGPVTETLQGHDLILVIGAPVFRYYPYVPGQYLPEGTRLLHVTDDPDEAARAPVGDSLLADPALACAALAEQLPASDRSGPQPQSAPSEPEMTTPLSPDALYATLARVWPEDGILVEESPSNMKALKQYLRIKRPASFFTASSGGLGYALPASVGIALGERHTGRRRPVVGVIGEGSFQYSIQALYTAAQHRLPVVFVVPFNEEYAILKAFAEFEHTPGVPGLDLPGLDIPTIARGYGCQSQRVESADALADALGAATKAEGPTVLAVPITKKVPALI
ncbi:benzoylformate decarboxylase [Planosporangium flavigriseum]|uniref:Benzoylformate decarboxylase n=1 Tax=Planosporangium flavigriseum TaxID=373681 RepID=A0A8J3LVW6_9ACTN|nr:benzoylformate decarboxylase [Planosporangium flavigriseum]NJC65980.1 benzoylformate decarboxylase [Planosporangium flavigriseum]GIG74556.1 benzoylformate decarboxylase [Planosporangium flavigriseum]